VAGAVHPLGCCRPWHALPAGTSCPSTRRRFRDLGGLGGFAGRSTGLLDARTSRGAGVRCQRVASRVIADVAKLVYAHGGARRVVVGHGRPPVAVAAPIREPRNARVEFGRDPGMTQRFSAC